MTIPNLLSLQHENPTSIYLLPQGAFYHAYNEGPLLLNASTGYKLRIGSVYSCFGLISYTFCGFPISALDKVITRLALFYINHAISLEQHDTAVVLTLS